MPRNIVLISADSLRADFLSPYGCDFIPTPNIESLAQSGVTYTNAITAATVCAPARASALTGLLVSDHDYWTNQLSFRPGIEFLPERLRDAGYLTAKVGVDDHITPDNDMGYRYIKLFTENKPGSVYLKELQARHPEATHYGMSEDGYHFKYPEDEHYDRWSCDNAVEFIQSYAESGTLPDGTSTEEKPFFLNCAFLMPHAPYLPPKEVAGLVDESKMPARMELTRDDIPAVEAYRRAWIYDPAAGAAPENKLEEQRKLRLAYCEMVAEIDRLVGRILDALRATGLWENTTVLLTADHGSMEYDYGLDTKGPFPYHGQLFIPMIVANHPRLEAGTRCDCLCGNIDIGATFLDIAGDTRAFGLSRSLIGMADGAVPEREVHISEFCDSCKNLIDKRYTFSYYPFTGVCTLFDRIEDPDETVNLANLPEYTEVKLRFMMHLTDYMILAKGVRIEAHDLAPEVKAGIEKKDPAFLDHFDICYPLPNMASVEKVREAGLDGDYNEFCRDREIKAHYGVYFK